MDYIDDARVNLERSKVGYGIPKIRSGGTDVNNVCDVRVLTMMMHSHGINRSLLRDKPQWTTEPSH